MTKRQSSKTKKTAETNEPVQAAGIINTLNEATRLRNKDREFHGLEREFVYHQEDILKKFKETADLKHIRDVGASREALLRKFLQESGYIPFKYGISTTSARVISPSGHTSKEIDILIYDKLNTISLMNRQGIFDAFPIENVHGIIQVKSKLTKAEIITALDNIASYKGLKANHQDKNEGGFGMLFAYDSEMQWSEIVDEVKRYSSKVNSKLWCNTVCILSKGLIFHGSDNNTAITNAAIKEVSTLTMHGRPNYFQDTLFGFYTILLDLISRSGTAFAGVNQYHRLPLIAGPHSYNFTAGAFGEILNCPHHGKYQKRISQPSLERIIAVAKETAPQNWIQATDIASGKPGDDFATYNKQAEEVRIFNPESLPLSEVLLSATIPAATTADFITTDGMSIWIPYYYIAKENLYEECPKCESIKNRKQKSK